jgi:hypothetical protein
MRTTVTLDADVQLLLKRAMRTSDSSFKQTLNDAVRAGLRNPTGATKAAPFLQRTYKMGPPLLDLTKANALVGELEDNELIARMQQRSRRDQS